MRQTIHCEECGIEVVCSPHGQSRRFCDTCVRAHGLAQEKTDEARARHKENMRRYRTKQQNDSPRRRHQWARGLMQADIDSATRIKESNSHRTRVGAVM